MSDEQNVCVCVCVCDVCVCVWCVGGACQGVL